MKAALERTLSHRLAEPVLLSTLAVLYLVAYFNSPWLPDDSHPSGWWQWFDQSRYYTSTAALADLRISRDDYWYPLGYSLLGAPFVRLWPLHPYLIPNLALSLACASLFLRICRVFLARAEAMFVTVLIIVLLRQNLYTGLVIPWNTIPTHFIAYLSAVLLLSRPPTGRLVVALSALASFALLCRPLDAAMLAPMLVASTLRLPNWAQRIRYGAAGAAFIAATYTAVGMLNLRIFDSWITNYERSELGIGVLGFPAAEKFYSLVLDASPIYQNEQTMLAAAFPWLLLIVPGAIYSIQKRGWPMAALLLSVSGSAFLYINYNKLLAHRLYVTGVTHYFTWLLPLLALLAFLSIRSARRSLPRAVYVASISLPIALAWCIRLEAAEPMQTCISRVSRDPHALAIGDEAGLEPVGYDLAFIPSWNSDEPMVVQYGDRTLKRYREYTPIAHPSGGAVLYFAHAVDPLGVRIGSSQRSAFAAEFRRLRWRFGASPSPMIRSVFGPTRRASRFGEAPPEPRKSAGFSIGIEAFDEAKLPCDPRAR